MKLPAALVVLLALAPGSPGAAPVETPSLAAEVRAGSLPPVGQRLPAVPRVDGEAGPGRHGGDLRVLMAKAKDTRQIVVYGYARLLCYTPELVLEPDILERVEVRDDRVFTLHLRPGHKWSDGHPFTSEDFRYWWEDVANNEELSPTGPPAAMLADGRPPVFEVLGETAVRYSWGAPNATFLAALAGARPLYIYRPAHYLRRFHAAHAPPEALAAAVKEARRRSWASLHNKLDSQYKNDNPDLPTLQPWVPVTRPPADRFVFVRNPYYHRVGADGRQLPYIDRVVMNIAASGLIPAKTAAGASDLQARYLRFDNVTFLKRGEEAGGYRVRLWRTGKGAHVALYPNLNAGDPVWRALFRDRRVRRALSLGLYREEVNEVIYFGLALTGNNSLLPGSPLYDEALRQRWAGYDPEAANALLDEAGLARGDDGLRLLPDGRPAELIVETAGESTEETDILHLVHDSWLKLGIKLHAKPLQRELLRNRIFSGQALMSVWSGWENGLASADMSPAELAPTSQQQLQWPKWGQHHETRGAAGEPADMDAPRRLYALNEAWRRAGGPEERRRIWREMLEIHAEEVFVLGVVGGIRKPVVVSERLRGVPEEGYYNWEPGAHFGIFRPDRFWLAD